MAKTDWTMNDTVKPDDMNEIGQEINDNTTGLAAHKAEIASEEELGHVKIGTGLTIEEDGTLNAQEVDPSQFAPASHVGARGTGVHGLATTSLAGFMSASDKIKLNAIPEDGIPYVAGTYSGDASGRPESPVYQTINLGFRPSAVLVVRGGDISQDSGQLRSAIAVDGSPVIRVDIVSLEILSNGFRVCERYSSGTNGRIELNTSGETYNYIAFR